MGMGVSMSWKARCWVVVGVVIVSKVWLPWVMVLRVRVAMWARRDRKDLMGLSSVSVLRLALAAAVSETVAGAMGLVRVGGVSSVKVSGARARRRCQVR